MYPDWTALPLNKALQLTGPQRVPIDLLVAFGIVLGRFERASAAGPAAWAPGPLEGSVKGE